MNLQDLQQHEISAQKRYKLQLQADINKLKEKYSVHLSNQKSGGQSKFTEPSNNTEVIQMLLTPKSTKPIDTSLMHTTGNEATPQTEYSKNPHDQQVSKNTITSYNNSSNFYNSGQVAGVYKNQKLQSTTTADTS